jgi:hypothetical protein
MQKGFVSDKALFYCAIDVNVALKVAQFMMIFCWICDFQGVLSSAQPNLKQFSDYTFTVILQRVVGRYWQIIQKNIQ